ncbi:hypothetical protein B0A49_04141 [Cryomyces minteri]|uniref:Uncharacterized protein n=1 Tax=Cryomyces minteri TaxID=331657 RepID=A0A4U0X5S7_9PEZI|nr:hypothetical protein B0A49_04141 [Cryomyces minteri]
MQLPESSSGKAKGEGGGLLEDMLHAIFNNGMPAFSVVNETDYAQECANLSESVGSTRFSSTSQGDDFSLPQNQDNSILDVLANTREAAGIQLHLLTGGAASSDALERSYFTTQANGVAIGSGLRLWNDVRNILSNFLCLQRSLREDTCDVGDLSYDLSAPTDPQPPDQMDRHARHSRAVYAEQNYTPLANNAAAASPFLRASPSVLCMNSSWLRISQAALQMEADKMQQVRREMPFAGLRVVQEHPRAEGLGWLSLAGVRGARIRTSTVWTYGLPSKFMLAKRFLVLGQPSVYIFPMLASTTVSRPRQILESKATIPHCDLDLRNLPSAFPIPLQVSAQNVSEARHTESGVVAVSIPPTTIARENTTSPSLTSALRLKRSPTSTTQRSPTHVLPPRAIGGLRIPDSRCPVPHHSTASSVVVVVVVFTLRHDRYYPSALPAPAPAVRALDVGALAQKPADRAAASLRISSSGVGGMRSCRLRCTGGSLCSF